MNRILLDLRDLTEGVSRVDVREDLECLELHRDDYSFHSPVAVALDVNLGDEEITVAGKVSIPAQVECARCACLFPEEVKAEFGTRYIRTAGEPDEEGWMSDEGVREIRFDRMTLDLTDDVRQAVLLSLPIRALCSPECRGLCQRCGANLNEGECSCDRPQGHPAWSALGKLKDRGTRP